MEEDMFEAETNMDDAIEAFMNGDREDDDQDLEDTLEDDEDQSEGEDEDASEEDEDGDGDEPDDDDEDSGDEDEDDDDDPDADPVDDEAEVLITVGGEEKRVQVKDLKELYGQTEEIAARRNSLTSQARAVEAQGIYLAQILQQRFEAAQTAAAKYADVDLFRAARELEPEEFEALKSAKENADSELLALEREGQEFLQRTQNTRNELLKEQAQTSLKEIVKAIPEWNDDLYSKVRTYAVSQGMDVSDVNEVVNSGAIIMMHKAMKYDEVQAKQATVKKKVTKAPKKVVRKSDVKTDKKTTTLKTKKRAAMETGDVDDVAELFMAALND